MVNEFLLALQFLTIIQIKKTLPFDARSFGRSAAFFPLIGAILGAIIWGLDIVLQDACPLSLRNLTLVAVLGILSRGLHFDGLADSVDGLFGGHDRERRLAIMKDSRIGTFGVLALLGVVLFKVRALDVLSGGNRYTALLLGPTLSRWTYVVLAYRAVPARQDGLGVLLVRGVFFRELAVASGIALLVISFAGGRNGLIAMMMAFVLTLGAMHYCTARLGGVTGDTFGAVGELTETAIFCLYVLLCSTLLASPIGT